MNLNALSGQKGKASALNVLKCCLLARVVVLKSDKVAVVCIKCENSRRAEFAGEKYNEPTH